MTIWDGFGDEPRAAPATAAGEHDRPPATIWAEALMARPAVAAIVNDRPADVGRFAESLLAAGLSAEEATAVLHLTEALPSDQVIDRDVIEQPLRILEARGDVIERSVESDVPPPSEVADPDLIGTAHIDKVHPDQTRAHLSHPPDEPDTDRQALLRKNTGERI